MTDLLKKSGSGPDLSPETLRRIAILFAPEEQEAAATLLFESCGHVLPFQDKADMHMLERFRFAALKYSDGNLARLEAGVKLAQKDWRDLLMATGFAHDAQAHQKWKPKPANEPSEIDPLRLIATIHDHLATLLVPLGFERGGDVWRRAGEVPQTLRVQTGLTSRMETRFFLRVTLEGKRVVVLHLPKLPGMGEHLEQGYFFRAGDQEEALGAAVALDVAHYALPLFQRFTSSIEVQQGFQDGTFHPHLPVEGQAWIF